LVFGALAKVSARFVEPGKRLAARIELRHEFGLPKRECIVDTAPSAGCSCLSEVLDRLVEAGETMARQEVVEAAEKAHAERAEWLERRPAPRLAPPAPVATAEAKRQPFSRSIAKFVTPRSKATPAGSVQLERREPPDARNFGVWKRQQSPGIEGLLERKF
jgi:hypothetical protein